MTEIKKKLGRPVTTSAKVSFRVEQDVWQWFQNLDQRSYYINQALRWFHHHQQLSNHGEE